MKIHHLLSLLFTIGLIFSADAQDNYLDSLENLAQSDIHDSLKINLLYELTATYKDVDTDKSIYYAKQLLEASIKTRNDLFTGVAYNELGDNYLDKQYGLDTIIKTYQKAWQQAKIADNPRLKAIISNGMAMTYDNFGQIDKALQLYQRAYTILDESGDKASAIRCLGNAALVLKNHGDLATAKRYYLKAIKIAKAFEDEVMVSQLGSNLASVYVEENKIDSAIILYKKAIEVNKAAGNKYFTSLSLARLGRIYNDKKQYELALKYLQEGYQFATEIKDSYCIGTALSYLCDTYFQQKEYDKTIHAAKEALDVLGENGDMLTRTQFYEHLSNSYEAQGNYQLAFENQKMYHLLSDSLFNVETSKQITNLKLEHEVAQKESENKVLKAKQETIIRNRNYIAIGLITALLLAIGWAITFYRSNRQKKKHNEELSATVAQRTTELQTANYKLEKANHNLEQANYELRTFNFIASHDIKEPIRVIGGYAGLIFKRLPNDLKEQLGDYFDTIKQSTTQLYTLVEDFAYYSTLSKDEIIKTEPVDLNLLTYSVIDNLQESIKKYNGEVLINHLPTINSSKTFLFTTLKNLIENGLKYNKSKKPTVEINYSETQTHHQIIVTDNGIGIDEKYHDQIFDMFKRLHNRGAYEGSGIGLAIVKLVTEKLGGTVEIKSEVEKGTKFILNLPK